VIPLIPRVMALETAMMGYINVALLGMSDWGHIRKSSLRAQRGRFTPNSRRKNDIP